MGLISENINFWEDRQLAQNLQIVQGELILNFHPNSQVGNIELIEEKYKPSFVDAFVYSGAGIETAPFYLRGFKIPDHSEILDISLFNLGNSFNVNEFVSMTMLFRRFAVYFEKYSITEGSLGYYSMVNKRLYHLKTIKNNIPPISHRMIISHLISEI